MRDLLAFEWRQGFGATLVMLDGPQGGGNSQQSSGYGAGGGPNSGGGLDGEIQFMPEVRL